MGTGDDSGGETAGSRLYKGIIGGLVLLCVLLLAGLIVLAIMTDQLQTSYNNLTIEHYQLLYTYENLTTKHSQLQTSYGNLTTEHNRLQKENDKCQNVYSYLEQRCTYFDSSVYIITTEKKTWSASRQDCIQRGADLMIIDSAEEQNFISGCLSTTAAWIGLNDIDTEGTFMWVDGTALSTGFWRNGEPNNYGGNEDCALTVCSDSPLKSWNDCPCDFTVIGVCEKHF